ncbi:hypothetical protein RhiirA1_440701 [Rhizophagus irregularis]|uniref:Protein kinase domain-containing protein n=1 Tax=Rhizophagus irregularis TaxID=588596 RepID=A0A2N0RYA0_9GLOM|nr:hypothetical protein RhiirA1_440701 [Rhizophagus irregularis]
MTSSEWIDKKIEEEDINFFRYDEFINLEKVGEGAFGIVNRADWNSGKIKIALKILTNNKAISEINNENNVKSNMEKFIKELKILRKVGFHPNINQFYGITRGKYNFRESPSFLTPKIYEDERENIINATDEIIDSYLKRNNIGWSRDFSFPKILEKHKSISNKIFGNLINNQTIRQYEVMVGYFYEDGFGVYKNEIVAFEWYKKASKLNNLNGQFELGYCYNYGYSIKKNLKEALKSYKLASDEGLNIATYFLAISYEFDNEKNRFDEAFKLYKKSAEKGFIPSQYKLATFYEIGKGTQQNKTEALKWYKLFLENNGEYNPTYNIKDTIMEKTTLSIKSLINDIEREITRNELDEIIEAYLKHNSIGETKSFSFFKVLKNYESKSQEIFKCLNNNQTIRNYEVIVGKFHEMGFGTNENMDKAFKWYIDASKQNNYNGILETGNCYYNGNGVVKNCDKAFEFFQRAVNESKEKLNRALYSLATCYKSGDEICHDGIVANDHFHYIYYK